MLFIRLLAALPLWILYRVADFLTWMARDVIKYRKKVVDNNLANSFPEKSAAERKGIRNRFYRNLADIAIESIKTLSISRKSLLNKIELENPDLLSQYHHQNQSVLVLSAHMGNWEWLLSGCSIHLESDVEAMYQELHNSFADKLMYRIRSRFGSRMLEMKKDLRSLMRTPDRPRVLALVADQGSPAVENLYWTQFLNQPTGFYRGPVHIAHRLQYPVLFVSMHRKQRGKYRIRFHEIAYPPFNKDPDYILERYAQLAEKAIKDQPEDWLWSHRRWKYHPPENPNYKNEWL